MTSIDPTKPRWEWSVKIVDGEAGDGQPPESGEVKYKFEVIPPDKTTVELENTADNTDVGYYGNEAFELIDFESEIEVEYIKGVAPPPPPSNTENPNPSLQTPSFSPDYTTYSFIVDGEVPPNLVFTSEIDEETNVFKIKASGRLSLLKDYVPAFILPENFTYDEYDSPDGFYQQGFNITDSGGNYKFLRENQPKFHEITFDIKVSVSNDDPEKETTETKNTVKTFKMTIRRNFSAMRNQFVAGYLDEQAKKGEFEFFTYKGTKYYNSDDYVNALVDDLAGWKFNF